MTEADYVLIDKKLSKELSPDEEHTFEQRHAQDSAFAEEYQLQRQLVDALRIQHARQLKDEMKALHEEVKAEQRKRYPRWVYTAAATVVLLLVAAVALFYFRSPSPDLYAEYYKPYRAQIIPRGATLPARRDHAESLYTSKQFAAAIPLLKKLSAEDSTMTDRWRLLLGNAYLQSDSVTQALRQFEKVIISENSEYRQFAHWYLVMGYLKENNTAAARNALQPIATQPGLFQSRAKELLHDLP